MANTTTEVITVDGVSLKTYAKNIESLGATLRTPGKRGANAQAAMRSGSIPQFFKPHDEGNMVWPMWVRGCDDNGDIPGGSSARKEFFKRVDELTALFTGFPHVLLDVRHTLPDATIRQCFAECAGILDFTTQSVNPIGLFAPELSVPASYWQDVAATDSGKVTSIATTWSFGAAGSTAPLDDATYTISGPITNPTISDATTGSSVRYNGSLTVGQSLTLNAATFAVTAVGFTPNLANLVLSSTNGRLMRLVANGPVNTGLYFVQLQGTGTGAGVGLQIVGKRKFLVG